MKFKLRKTAPQGGDSGLEIDYLPSHNEAHIFTWRDDGDTCMGDDIVFYDEHGEKATFNIDGVLHNLPTADVKKLERALT